jgi:hypothetical protein
MRACLCWPSVYSARFAFYLSYRAHRDTFSHSRACDDLPILSSPPPYPFFLRRFHATPFAHVFFRLLPVFLKPRTVPLRICITSCCISVRVNSCRFFVTIEGP